MTLGARLRARIGAIPTALVLKAALSGAHGHGSATMDLTHGQVGWGKNSTLPRLTILPPPLMKIQQVHGIVGLTGLLPHALRIAARLLLPLPPPGPQMCVSSLIIVVGTTRKGMSMIGVSPSMIASTEGPTPTTMALWSVVLAPGPLPMSSLTVTLRQYWSPVSSLPGTGTGCVTWWA